MYKQLLVITLLLSTFIYATETNTTIEKEIPTDLNRTVIENIENNTSDETNRTIIKKDKMVKSFPTKQSCSADKNFNMTKGNSERGQEIFIQKLRKSCQTTSYKFASNYAQDEWEDIAEAGRFREIMFKLCLNLRDFYQDDWSPDLYQFFYEHASDS